MIITLILLGLIILPVIFLLIDNHFNYGLGILGFIGEVFIYAWTVIIPCLAVCLGLIISANLNADVKYENKMFERAVIVQTYEELAHDDEVFTVNTNGEYYKQVVEFNNSLRTAKKWADNPWVNWFVVEELAEIDYIDLEALSSGESRSN